MKDVPIRYYGIICATCGTFNPVGSYPNVNPGVYGTDADVSGVPWECKNCGQVAHYSRADVAHSDWPDGREPHYPHRC
jgi:hypothetical protein